MLQIFMPLSGCARTKHFLLHIRPTIIHRIYADGVINHMTGADSVGTGTAGSYHDATLWSFPGVPYNESKFNGCDKCDTECSCVNDWLHEDHVSQVILVQKAGIHNFGGVDRACYTLLMLFFC